MGLLNQQRMANPTAPNLPQMPPTLPSMPGGLPTFGGQAPALRPGMGAQGMGGPQTQGGATFSSPNGINLNLPMFGHGYEGGMNLNDMGHMQSLQSMFRNSYMPQPMGPWSLAGQRVTGPDMPFESLGPRMNGQMPVTWYAEDWKRNLPD